MLVVNKQDIRLAIFILLALLTSTLSWRTGVNSSAPSTLSCWLLALFSDTSCVSHLNMKTVSGWEAYLPLNVCKSSVHFQFYPLPHVPCLSHPDKWALKCCDAGECRYERVQLKGRFHCRPRDYKITSHTEPWGIFFHGWLLGKSQNYGPVMHSYLSCLFVILHNGMQTSTRYCCRGDSGKPEMTPAATWGSEMLNPDVKNGGKFHMMEAWKQSRLLRCGRQHRAWFWIRRRLI